MHTSIANTGLKLILSAMNIPAPDPNNMQNAANIVGKKVIQENDKDMAKICDNLKSINNLKRLSSNAPINIAMDAQYSNPTYGSQGNTPSKGQPR